MQRLRFNVAYDGNMFYGSSGFYKRKWDKVKTVQSCLMQGFYQFSNTENCTLSSRTDRGVHAISNVGHVDVVQSYKYVDKMEIQMNNFFRKQKWKMNIQNVEQMDGFDCRRYVKQREYRYYILVNDGYPYVLEKHAWMVKHALNVEKMKLMAELLVGTMDFKAFVGRRDPLDKRCTIRSIYDIEIVQTKNGENGGWTFGEFGYDRIEIKVVGKSFLTHMVRNIVGFLVHVGLEKQPIVNPLDMFDTWTKRADMPGVTAPPHGLFLHRIEYNTQ